MLVINSPVLSCCGQAVNNCSCGGHREVGAELPYSGKYSKGYKPPAETVRNTPEPPKPTPMPVLAWNWGNENQPADEAIPVANHGMGLYAGAGAGQAVRNLSNRRSEEKPTPLPTQVWNF